MWGRAKIAADAQRELQRLWIPLVRGSWRTLVIVPTHPSISARPITSALLEAARAYELGRFQVVDACGVSSAEGLRVSQEISERTGSGIRVVATIDAPFDSPGGVPLLLVAEAALVLVRYGATALRTTRLTVDMVGRERVLGCIALGPRAALAPRKDAIASVVGTP